MKPRPPRALRLDFETPLSGPVTTFFDPKTGEQFIVADIEWNGVVRQKTREAARVSK